MDVAAGIRIEDLSYRLSIENLEGSPREIRLGSRDRARLLVVERESGSLQHSAVNELPRWMSPGDVLVLNNSKRIPGVLKGRTARGGQVELRFVEALQLGAIGVEATREGVVVHVAVPLHLALDLQGRNRPPLGHQEGDQRELADQLLGVLGHVAQDSVRQS